MHVILVLLSFFLIISVSHADNAKDVHEKIKGKMGKKESFNVKDKSSKEIDKKKDSSNKRKSGKNVKEDPRASNGEAPAMKGDVEHTQPLSQETSSEFGAPADVAKPHHQKLPLPRFVCLKAAAVNMHVGPGDQYPVEWRYVKQFLPVEIIAEFDHWRQIRDSQGTVGWVHKTLLSSKRFTMIQNKVVNLYADPNLESRVIATVEPGVIGKVIECNASVCRIDIQGVRGWIKRDFLFGVYPDETRF
mgnify:CR=1 FL=1